MTGGFPPSIARARPGPADNELTRRAQEACAQADVLLGALDGVQRPTASDLRRRARGCVELLASRVADSEEVTALIDMLLWLSDEMSEHELTARFCRIAACERGLARLRLHTTTADLIDGVCDELVRSLGMRRAMLARVERGTWRPWKSNAAMLEEAWVSDWIERPIPLDELTLETRLLTERRAELVLDTHVEGMAPVVRAAEVSSYVVAPIMPDGHVVGFLHADHGIGGDACDTMDRDLLWAFAEGFGHQYEQVLLIEELQARRAQIQGALTELGTGLDGITDQEFELRTMVRDEQSDVGLSAGGLPLEGFPMNPRLDRLTVREREVLELVVAGARNNEIGERLGISVGTVKSHVTHLLTKLGVVNRSQAIALYLGAGHSEEAVAARNKRS
jgi:DNA-binding CsgD family transcriptional regulator